MKINMQFPRCPKCHTSDPTSYHQNCVRGGISPLQFETTNNIVECMDCGHTWEIHSSNYYCRCGHVFSATEVENEINAIIEVAHMVAAELLRKQKIQEDTSEITGKSVGKWIKGFVEGSAINIGYAIGRIVGVVMKIFGI